MCIRWSEEGESSNAGRFPEAEETPSFVDRWRGRFEPAGKNDDRFLALAEKYL